jgi:predicted GNAT family acetyltransferase
MTNSEVIKLTIENNEAAQRWEAHLDQHVAVAAVPPELEGQGVASRLVQTALDDARKQHLAVVPFCPFVTNYIRKHPDYRDLIEGEPGKGQNG